jgi:6-phosphogluconolactonase (cycloisomerase 2 family)
MTLRSLIGRTASTLLMLGLAACGGGGGDDSSQAFTIGGTVTGLASGTQLVMNNNGGAALTVSANGAFTFAEPVAANGSYLVRISTQPTGQTCSVANFQGAGVTANVSTVGVTCSPVTHTVGGAVTGLAAGRQVTLNNNGADALAVSADGAFTFATPVPFNGSYAVTVGTQPTGQTCTVSNGSGAGVVADISNVAVTCATNTFTIGVTVSGLTTGKQVTLNNNGGDPLTVLAAQNGVLQTFSTPVTFNGSYSVTVGTQPTGQTCTVSNGSGSGVAAKITNVTVTCSTNTYTIGGTITGLISTQQVTLNNNGGNPLTLTVGSGGTFTFTTPVAYGAGYAVTVGTSPTGETCRITNGTGTNVTANVSSVSVNCRLALAYVTNKTDSTISQYTIGLNGTLTSIGAPIATGATPNVVAVDPTGRFAYVANFGADPGGAQGTTVSQYTIGATGVLTANGTATTQLNPYSIAIDPTGKYAYVTNQGSNSVSQFTIGANGALTPMSPASVACGSLPYKVTIDATGRYVYVANLATSTTAGSVSQYTIGAGGALVPMTPATVTVGSGLGGPIGVAVNAAGTRAYATNLFDRTVSQFSINGTGGLVPLGVANVATGATPYPMTLTPDGLYAYWSNKDDNTVTECKFTVGGALDCSLGQIGAGTLPKYIAVDPFSHYVYAVNSSNGGAGTVSQYTIGAGGVLGNNSVAPTAPTGNGPFAITTTK